MTIRLHYRLATLVVALGYNPDHEEVGTFDRDRLGADRRRIIGQSVSAREARKRESLRPIRLEDVSASPSLTYASKKFFERGGKYVWGTNDCSVFVSDYLLKRIPTMQQRLTTANLDSSNMRDLGFVTETVPKGGDVINYRYQSRRSGEAAGHCGIIWKRPEGTFVIHNCVSKGLVMQPYVDFVGTAVALGVPKSNIKHLRHPASLSAASKTSPNRPQVAGKR